MILIYPICSKIELVYLNFIIQVLDIQLDIYKECFMVVFL